jgi:3D (Asp-Asp-Asp) domain-containing protein
MYIARWGRSARAIAFCVALALPGCEGTTSLPVDLKAPAPQVATTVSTSSPAPAGGREPVREYGLPLGVFQFTMYYVAAEEDHPPAVNDNRLSGQPDNLSGEPDKADHRVTIYHRKGCAPLAELSPSFATQLDIQGTGKLRDGRVVNTSGNCPCPNSPCYFEIDQAWAMGPNGRLSPFRSVAVDTRVVPLGTILYVPDLDGVRVPGRAPWGGFVHDGCVVADDRGGGIRGRDLDFFVAKKTYSNILDARHRLKRVSVFEGKGWCEKRGGKVRRARVAL